MARGDIYKITAAENINKQEGLAKNLDESKKQKLEQDVDKRLLHGNDILGQDKRLDDQERQNDLFKKNSTEDTDDKTIDLDRKRGVVMKRADEDKDGQLEVHEYDKHKDDISEAFLSSQKEQKNPVLQDFEQSKKDYYKDIREQGQRDKEQKSQEEKLVFNEVGEQLTSTKKDIISGNADKGLIAGNARNSITAGNRVDVVATNEITTEQFATNDPFNYAAQYQLEWNRKNAKSMV